MKRAIGVAELLSIDIPHYDFDGKFYEAFGRPEKYGVWFIYGNSTNGKTSFLIQLAKYLTKFDRVLYNSLEEGTRGTMQQSLRLHKMNEVAGKFTLVKEMPDELTKRLSGRKSPKIIFFDSIQYGRFTTKKFFDFVNKFEDNHLLIFSSQVERGEPRGTVAFDAMYHATMKIWVEGFRAFSKGRYFGPSPHYTIYEEKALEYWLK